MVTADFIPEAEFTLFLPNHRKIYTESRVIPLL